jgi:hypothetical protein
MEQQETTAAVANQQEDQSDAARTKFDVSGLPVYHGPLYRSLDSQPLDITKGKQFHSFHHRPVDEVGYSPLTLDDFRFPVVKRTMKEFDLEREYYPKHSKMVWNDFCHGYTVTAFFFTRDMVRDHIQRLIDEYYICDPAILQQTIDYYAEVTPQCGEAISWVWFSVDDSKHPYADKRENRYFMRYLANFKDKFYLQFGDTNAQDMVDNKVHKFLYQYQKRGKHQCGPDFKPIDGCTCETCKEEVCSCCPLGYSEPHDCQLLCQDFDYRGFTLDPNQHYLYYPRKVVIEDITYDGVAQAYRWKFAWRFDNCEQDFLAQMCHYGMNNDFALVLSDPTWYGYAKLEKNLTRDILASVDPQTWGNVWPAGKIPIDMENCPCLYPYCDGNCQPEPEVGWEMKAPVPDQVEQPVEPDYIPEPEQPVEVVGRG